MRDEYPFDNLTLRAHFRPEHGDVGLWAKTESGEVVRTVAMESVPYVMGNPYSPMLTMSDAGASALMDALWTAGIRPAETRYASDIVQAKEDHIKDLRSELASANARITDLLNRLGRIDAVASE